MKRTSKLLVSLASVIVAGLAVALAVQLTLKAGDVEPKLNIQDTPISRELKASTSFAPMIKKAVPSVVFIYSTRVVKMQPYGNPFFGDPFFRHFFGDDDNDINPQSRRPRTHRSQSLGSGVIVASDGYILTANHVIAGAEEVKVQLADGSKELDAKIVGADPATDVAVLKVDADNLPAITIANSDQLEVGDLVLAIGDPFGVGQSVTMGIVSALGRGGFHINDYENFIQTDAAINPGNSGGALVDAEGRLVGINTAIITRSGTYQGVGFAVPINLARQVMERIVKYGKVTRGYLGVYIQNLTPDLAEEFHAPDENGALVGSVTPDTPAAKAGLKNGDVIVEFDGRKVKDSSQLRFMVAQTLPDTKVTLKMIRDGKEQSVTVTLATLPDNMLAANDNESGGSDTQANNDALDGVEVTDLDSQARQDVNIPARIQGALVASVASGSPADDAGLKAGDVIVEINHHPVRNADQAVDLARNLKGNRILLRVWSRNENGLSGTHYLVIEKDKGDQ